MPRLARIVAAGIYLLAAAPACAVHPIKVPAPDFATTVWINAKPIRLEYMRGRRVLLVAFINASNINSLRSIKTLNQWWGSYALHGLMVIGVHSPAYAFQNDLAGLKRELRRLGVDFPVAIDTDKALWKAYRNEGWPSFYVVDHRGQIIYDQIGEGRYSELEHELRRAIVAAGYDPPSAPMNYESPVQECGPLTPETPVVVNGQAPKDDRGELVVAARQGEITKKGKWVVEKDGLRLNQKNDDLNAAVVAVYRGNQALALLSPAEGKTTRVFVKQDDLWLHAGNAGADILFDDDGRSYVDVSAARLYWLLQNADEAAHALAVMPAQPQTGVYAFSFSDKCFKIAP